MIDFITGNKFKKNCHYYYDNNGLVKVSEPNDEVLRIFVKIDYVHSFFKQKQTRNYILYTHNGDYSVDDSYLRYMDDPFLLKWYGQNIMTKHPKLFSIPIGIANENWSHGNEKIFNEIIKENLPKNRLIYVNFDTTTNLHERNYCLEQIMKKGLKMSERIDFKEYLKELAQSYFVVSPNGNGVDCHKTWESLYVRTIPIVTKSINIDFYRQYPIIIIDDWSNFDLNLFTIDYYNKKWSEFNYNKLSFKETLMW